MHGSPFRCKRKGRGRSSVVFLGVTVIAAALAGATDVGLKELFSQSLLLLLLLPRFLAGAVILVMLSAGALQVVLPDLYWPRLLVAGSALSCHGTGTRL